MKTLKVTVKDSYELFLIVYMIMSAVLISGAIFMATSYKVLGIVLILTSGVLSLVLVTLCMLTTIGTIEVVDGTPPSVEVIDHSKEGD